MGVVRVAPISGRSYHNTYKHGSCACAYNQASEEQPRAVRHPQGASIAGFYSNTTADTFVGHLVGLLIHFDTVQFHKINHAFFLSPKLFFFFFFFQIKQESRIHNVLAFKNNRCFCVLENGTAHAKCCILFMILTVSEQVGTFKNFFLVLAFILK